MSVIKKKVVPQKKTAKPTSKKLTPIKSTGNYVAVVSKTDLTVIAKGPVLPTVYAEAVKKGYLKPIITWIPNET